MDKYDPADIEGDGKFDIIDLTIMNEKRPNQNLFKQEMNKFNKLGCLGQQFFILVWLSIIGLPIVIVAYILLTIIVMVDTGRTLELYKIYYHTYP
jgi:hypothetical protein